MTGVYSTRVAGRDDISGVDGLLARSYPVLLKKDYAPSVLVTALPLISRAQAGLVTCGTYFVVVDPEGTLCGAGGWTRHSPGDARSRPGVGHIRHVVTDHRRTRQGIGRRLMQRIFADAAAANVSRLECLSTRTAVPFYEAMGFVQTGLRDVLLRPGIVFPSVEMQRRG